MTIEPFQLFLIAAGCFAVGFIAGEKSAHSSANRAYVSLVNSFNALSNRFKVVQNEEIERKQQLENAIECAKTAQSYYETRVKEIAEKEKIDAEQVSGPDWCH